MASTVVGLFEQRSYAEAALSDLETSGFDRSRIDMKYPFTGDSDGAYDGLIRELEGEGVPNADARLYAEGVQAGDALEIAHVSDDKADTARDIMNRHHALDIHDASAVRSARKGTGMATGAALGAAGMGAAAATQTTAPAKTPPRADATVAAGDRTVRAGDQVVVPVVEEELEVGKRQIQRGGARIHTSITERPVEETVTLREEHVTVDRRPVDRAVTQADGGFKEQNFAVTETAEVPVVAKEARVVEEVVVGKTATDRTETVRDTVRRTDVEVEEVDTDVTNVKERGTTR